MAHGASGRGHKRAQGGGSGRGGPGDRARQGPQSGDFQYVRVSDGIVGTCQQVERRYVRVQSRPEAASVRPVEVLRQSLLAVARREAADEPYVDTGDFYMSICQDLRLQGIEDETAVAAREGFALCAMRARVGPPGENAGMDVKTLSDCLLHLNTLYARNPGQPRQLEFTVYRFLMWLGLTVSGASDTYAQLTASLKALAAYSPHLAVKHATDVMSSVVLGDAHRYFALAASLPAEAQEQRHIHDTLIAPALRTHTYQAVLKAYKFAIPLQEVGQLLGLHGDELSGWLRQKGAVIQADALDIDATKKAEKAAA